MNTPLKTAEKIWDRKMTHPPRHLSPPRVRALLALALSAALLFSGCGADDEGEFGGDPIDYSSSTSSTSSSSSSGGVLDPPTLPGASSSGMLKEEPEDGVVRVREWFPETLFVAPALITDGAGEAQVTVSLADSITTWRVSSQGSTLNGRLGSAVHTLDVFQSFFVDIDFPTYLTRNEQVTVPIAVFNYLDTPQDVQLDVQADDWFLLDGSTARTVSVGPGVATSIELTLTALRVGNHALVISASGQDGADAVRRVVRVKPDGQQTLTTRSGPITPDPMTGSVTINETLTVPADVVEDSASLSVSILPGYASQVVAGMETMLRLPGSTCFEVLISSTWPNALILNYLEATSTSSPDITATANGFINEGYQRSLRFETTGGGFDWWSEAPAGNPMLSAMAIIMLTDTAAVYPSVDDAVIQRTITWLLDARDENDEWGEVALKSGEVAQTTLRATCYAAWALSTAGYTGSELDATLSRIEGRVTSETLDAYTAALCANALDAAGRVGASLDACFDVLDASRIDDGAQAHWASDAATMVGAVHGGADVEVTALAGLAYANANRAPQTVSGVIDWLMSNRDPLGNWSYSTQGTVLALKLFLLVATEGGAADPTSAVMAVSLDGAPMGNRLFNVSNEEVVWTLASGPLAPGDHEVSIDFSGTGRFNYQISATHHVPWDAAPPLMNTAVTLAATPSATTLVVGEMMSLDVAFTVNEEVGMGMWVYDMVTPPGFSVQRDGLNAYLVDGQISSYELRDDHLFLYIDHPPVGEAYTLVIDFVPTYPLSAQFGPFEVFEYYNREINAQAPPFDVVVTP